MVFMLAETSVLTRPLTRTLANSGGGGSSASPYIITFRDGATSQTTSLTTSTYVEMTLADQALVDASSEVGGSHLGNGRFLVDEAGDDYILSIQGVLTSTQSASVGSNITYGIWDGANYVAVTADEVAYTLGSKNAPADSSSPYVSLIFTGITLGESGS